MLALVGAGLSNAEIGVRLFLVEGTVKAYVSAALSRLEVRNRVPAGAVARRSTRVQSDLSEPRVQGGRPSGREPMRPL